MYYTACLLLSIQWKLLCQAIVSLVYEWEGLLKIVWGLQPQQPPRSAPVMTVQPAHSVYYMRIPLTNCEFTVCVQGTCIIDLVLTII